MVSIESVAQALLALPTHEHGFNWSVKWTCLDILYFNSSNNRL